MTSPSQTNGLLLLTSLCEHVTCCFGERRLLCPLFGLDSTEEDNSPHSRRIQHPLRVHSRQWCQNAMARASASTASGNFLEMQILKTHSQPTLGWGPSNFYFNRNSSPGDCHSASSLRTTGLGIRSLESGLSCANYKLIWPLSPVDAFTGEHNCPCSASFIRFLKESSGIAGIMENSGERYERNKLRWLFRRQMAKLNLGSWFGGTGTDGTKVNKG